ncbi:MAG: hypothetical protein BWY88_00166 [Synergistetes bacterium ADurb.Bin520]|nr:MAG: hypothetical protein BWY88_00166 [Synergistetes bacterium ADurb.Bin520]
MIDDLPPDLFVGVLKHLPKLAVRPDHPAMGVDEDDALGGLLEELLEEGPDDGGIPQGVIRGGGVGMDVFRERGSGG